MLQTAFVSRCSVRHVAGAAAAVSLLVALGCQESPPSQSAQTQSPSASVAETPESTAPRTVPVSQTDAPDEHETLKETWELVLLGGAKVGHGHLKTREIEENGEKLHELTSVHEFSIQRLGQTVEQRIENTSIESPDGQVVRFVTKQTTGPSATTIKGHRRGDKILMETITLGKTQSTSIEWDATWGGFFADQQSLERQPMKPGETRTLRALNPVTAQADETELKAIGLETTKLLSGEPELLRIESTLNAAGATFKSILWTDAKGQALKMTVLGLQLETYRTTKTVALGPVEAVEVDLGERTIVKVKHRLPEPHKTKQIVYRARLADGNPAETFANCPSQSVRRIDDHTAEIIVRALRPNEITVPTAEASAAKPTEADVKPNNLIQSDDEVILAMAKEVAADQTDAWIVARTFEKYVDDLVTTKTFSQAIASAADVARSREGDCTEHAVLFAALCRARGIPARVAIGLVYVGREGGFAYHMWNEVWIKDQWIPMDATRGMGGIGAAHVKIADSDLSSASPVSALLPVAQVIGQLALEILSAE